MRKTLVLNLATGEESEFVNDLDPVENLITAYMLSNNLASQIHDSMQREKISKRVLYGQCSAGVGNLAVAC